MDNEEDEIDDLDDIRAIIEQTERNTRHNSNAAPASNLIVPYDQNALDSKFSLLQRPVVADTSFRQPQSTTSTQPQTTFASVKPVSNNSNYNTASSGSATINSDTFARPFTSISGHAPSTGGLIFGGASQQASKLNPFSGLQSSGPTNDRPMTLGSDQQSTRLFPAANNSKDTTNRSSMFTTSQAPKSDQLSVPIANTGAFSGKTASSGFGSLAGNSSSGSYYNRQPAVFTPISSNQNSDYRYREAILPPKDHSRPVTSGDRSTEPEKVAPTDKERVSSSLTGHSGPSQKSSPPINPANVEGVNNSATRPTSSGYYPPDNDELNPTLMSLREGPPNSRPKSRPRSRPRTTYAKHLSSEIRKSSTHSSSSDLRKHHLDNNHVSHSSRPERSDRPSSRHHHSHLTDDLARPSDRSLIFSPDPSFSRPRSRSPTSSTGTSKAVSLDSRPIGLPRPSTVSAGPITKMDKTGKIPKKSSSSRPRDNLASMGLLELLTKKKETEKELEKMAEERKNLERKKNDIERNSRGKSVENDPQHINLREDLVRLGVKEKETKSKLDSIWDKLESQYDHKRSAVTLDRNPSKPDPNKRAANKLRPKMSTTPGGPHPDVMSRCEREKKLMNSLFNLDDTNNWCQTCDLHLKSLKEYLAHIHSESHAEKMKNKSRPWFRDGSEFLTKGETLSVIDSIVEGEAKRSESRFSVDDFKAIFDLSKNKPLAKRTDKTDTNDNSDAVSPEASPKPLIDTYRGQRFLIPTTGAYCTLCNKGLFDAADVEHHMRSYEHFLAHTRMVFIDPSIELNYHREMNKSLEKLTASKENSEKEKREARLNDLVAAKVAKDQKKRSNLRRDEEGLLRTIEKNKVIPLGKSRYVQSKKASARDKSYDSTASDSPKKKRHSDGREKRVAKYDNSVKKKLALELQMSDDSDDGGYEPEILAITTLPSNDPDSPFPHLELSVHGNTHCEQLKDKRLATPCVVVMEKLDMDLPQYKRLLSDENALNRLDAKATLFNSIVKSEPFDWTLAPETYFDNSGDQIPITLNSDSEDDEQAAKPKTMRAKIKKEKPEKPSKSSGASNEATNCTDKKSSSSQDRPPMPEKSASEPAEVIKLFSDDEDDINESMNGNHLDNLISGTNSEDEGNRRLPTLTLSGSLTSKSMQFTSTIPEKNPNGTLNSIAINNDSSNDNLGGITFDSKSDEIISPIPRSASPPLDNIIISDHSTTSNLIIPTSYGDTTIEDHVMNNPMSININPVTSSITTTPTLETLGSYMVSATSACSMPTTFTSTTSCDYSVGMSQLNQHIPPKMETILCHQNPLGFADHHMGDSVTGLDVDDVDLGSNFQTPNLSDLSDPLVNTFNSDPHINSL